MPDKALDPVEWELVRADIAMEKARLKANRRLVQMGRIPDPDGRPTSRLFCAPRLEGAGTFCIVVGPNP